jgi:hypothetical protein
MQATGQKSLGTVEERLAALEEKVATYEAIFKSMHDSLYLIKINPIVTEPSQLLKASTPEPEPEPPVAASNEEDDDDRENPKVVIEPNRWKGPSYKGVRFSECPAEYLEAMVEFLDYCARDDKKTGKKANNGKPRYIYKEMDLRRAKHWLEEVKKTVAPAAPATANAPAANYSFDDA